MALQGEAKKVVRRVEALASKGARPDEVARAVSHLSRMGIDVSAELSPTAKAAIRKARRLTTKAAGVAASGTEHHGIGGDALVKKASQARTDAGLNDYYFNGRRLISPNSLTQTVNQARTSAERAGVVLGCAQAASAMLFGTSHNGSWESLATVPNHAKVDTVRSVIDQAGLTPLEPDQTEPDLDLQTMPHQPGVGILVLTTPLLDAGRDKVLLVGHGTGRPYVSSRRVTVASTDYFAVDLASLGEHVPHYLESGALSEDARTILGLALEEKESTLLEPVATVVTMSQQISTPRPVVR